MQLREALIVQSPSLALQRAAADEIARLDSLLKSGKSLEAAPAPVAQPLTDEQINDEAWRVEVVKEYEPYTGSPRLKVEGLHDFAHAIAAKLHASTAPAPVANDEQEMLKACPHFGPSPARDQWIAGWEAARGAAPAPVAHVLDVAVMMSRRLEADVDRIGEALAAPAPVAQPGWCPGCTPDDCPGCGPAARPAPVATLHADGHWTHPPGRDPLDQFSGKAKLDVYAAAPAPVAQSGESRSDELERLRVELGQERTPAYGDALRLCRKLEHEIAQLKARVC